MRKPSPGRLQAESRLSYQLEYGALISRELK